MLIVSFFPDLTTQPRTIKFSAGEVHPNIKVPSDIKSAKIYAVIRSSDDLMELLLTVSALRKQTSHVLPILLELPYLPYSRQDRVCAEGDALGLEVIGELLYMCNFAAVETYDVHSAQAFTYVDRLTERTQLQCVKDYTYLLARLQGLRNQNAVMVAPDQGAWDKSTQLGLFTGLGCYLATKHRDPTNGQITHTSVDCGDLEGRDVFIADDICDGGRTFIELAKVLKQEHNAGKVILYVTHGIFSKGFDELATWIDEVYVYNWHGTATTDNTRFHLRGKSNVSI